MAKAAHTEAAQHREKDVKHRTAAEHHEKGDHAAATNPSAEASTHFTKARERSAHARAPSGVSK